jgi:hypothetical protein
MKPGSNGSLIEIVVGLLESGKEPLRPTTANSLFFLSVRNIKDEKQNVSILLFYWSSCFIFFIHGYSGIDGFLPVLYGLEQVLVGNKSDRFPKLCADLFQTKLLAQHQ